MRRVVTLIMACILPGSCELQSEDLPRLEDPTLTHRHIVLDGVPVHVLDFGTPIVVKSDS